MSHYLVHLKIWFWCKKCRRPLSFYYISIADEFVLTIKIFKFNKYELIKSTLCDFFYVKLERPL